LISMKDIAKECGVSVATVSKALNDYSDIGKPTRERVRAAATRMGYYPNSSARALKTKRSYNLAVLFTDEQHSGLTHDFYSHVLESFKVEAEKNGFDITFATERIATKKTSYLEHCRYRGVDGVMIANIDFYDQSIQELILSDLPVVTLDHVFDNRIAVVSDNLKGIRDLVDYIYECGHRRIAYIHGADSSVTRARLNSFYHTMANHHLSVSEEYMREIQYRDVKAAEDETEHLMRLPQPPTCILYPDDLTCLGGVNRLRTLGLSVGKDISVAGYDGIFLSKIMDPPFTTVSQDTETIGRIAAQKLISLIEDPKATIIERIVVPGQLVTGASVARIG